MPAAPPASFHNQHQAGDSSSNTDASSISRQSIFEPVSGPLQDSPRTSRGSSPSDDERRRLVVSVSERIKPATPRHRHGKLVKANAPLTVSFEDPALSFSSPTSAAIRAVRATPKSPGTPSASDKPLPPLPPSGNATTSAESRCMSIEINKRNSYFASQDAYDSPTTQKRKPPEPPLSRRHSQLRGKSLTSNPEQPIPISEEDPDFSSTPSRSPSASSSRSPPVPPPPRSGPIRGGSSSSMATSISFTEASDQSSNVGMSANPSKTRPPVPPNRSPSISSIKRPTQRQRVAGSPSMAPPPPPPPRRRGSSQSSYTPSRLSGDHRSAARECFGSDCGTSSISEIHTTSLAPTGTENVMADLSALQKEVDELRGRFK